MQQIRHFPMPDVDDSDDGLDADEALLFGKASGHATERPSRLRMLVGGLVLATVLVGGAYLIATLAATGWRALPW